VASTSHPGGSSGAAGRRPFKLTLLVVLPALVAFVAQAAGCSAKACDERSNGADQDRCYHDALLALPPARIGQVREEGQKIVDPVVRSAAIHTWVVTNIGKVPMGEASSLCDLLDGVEATTCHRRVEAAHLRR
jgi:hypothetical protein